MRAWHRIPGPLRVAILAAVAFALLLADVLAGGLLTRADAWLDATANASRDTSRLWITTAGDTPVLYAVGALAALLLAWKRSLAHGAAAAVLGFVGARSIAWIKELVGRERPGGDYESMAFPSGHAGGSTLIWGILLLCAMPAVLHGMKNLEARERILNTLAVAWGILAFVTGAGRIGGGVHWMTDVLAGWAYGILWLAVTWWTLEQLPAWPARPRQDDEPGPADTA